VGLFSSKKVTNTGTAISPLLDEKPNLIRNAILKASFNDLPFVPTIVETLIAGYNIDPRSYYRQGENGSYRLGLPQGNVPTVTVREDEVKVVIAAEEGLLQTDINFQNIRYEVPSESEISRYILNNTSSFNYDRLTGILTGGIPLEVGFEAKLKFSETVDTNAFLDFEDTPYFYVPPDWHHRMTFEVYNTLDPLITRPDTTTSVQITPNTEYPKIGDFQTQMYVVNYGILDGIGGQSETITFLYSHQTEFYPTLDVYDEEDLQSPYFPIAPIRIDKQMVGDPNHAIPLYANQDFKKELENLLGDTGISLETLQTALEDNPDIDSVDDSYIIFAIPFGSEHDGTIAHSSKDQATLKYCYRYFKYLHDDVQLQDKAEFLVSEAGRGSRAPNFNVVHITDSELLQALYWNYVDIEEIDYLAPNTGVRNNAKSYSMGGTLHEDPPATDEDFYSRSELHFYLHDDDLLTTSKITVHGLYIQNDVIRDNVVVNTLWESFVLNAETPKDGFYVPISYRVLQTLNAREQDDVAFGGLMLVTYAVQVTTIKWYQKASFLKILKIVLFVIAIITMNPTIFTLELAASEIAYLIIESIVVNYLTGEALGIIFNALVDIIGLDAAIIFAILAVIASGGQALDLVNLGATMPTAIQMLEIATALTGEILEDVGRKTKQLASEILDIETAAATAQEKIDAANADLGQMGIDVNWIVDKMLVPEYPSTYYNRTLNPSIGLSSIDTIDYFYDNALNLKIVGNN
jgi:hypothetical protein